MWSTSIPGDEMEIGEWCKIRLPVFNCESMYNFPDGAKESTIEQEVRIMAFRGNRVIVQSGNRQMIVDKSDIISL